MGREVRSQRGWLQFGLRSILLVTLGVAIFLAVGRAYIDPYFAQDQALRVLKNHQVSVRTQYTLPSRFRWLERIDSKGKERFHEVVHLDMTGGDFADTHLRHLMTMRRLQTLIVRGSAFDATHLERLAQLPELRLIVLDATSVRDHEAQGCAADKPDLKIRLSQRSIFEKGLEKMQALTARIGSSRLTNFAQVGWYRSFAVDLEGASCTPASRTEDLGYWQERGEQGLDLGVEHWLDVDSLTLYSPVDEDIAKLSDARTTRRLSVKRSRLTADGLTQLGFMHKLQVLSLSFPSVTPELSALAQRTSLTHLSLMNAGVTDDSLVHLQALQSLRSLALSANPLEGHGLRQLRNVPLEELKLNKTQLNGEGMAALATLRTLRRLELADTTIDSNAVAQLKPLTNLEKLVLRHTRVDDDVMQHLGAMTSLESLSLQNTAISGAQLSQLQSLHGLRRLDVSLTRVTEEQVARLQSLLPQLTVSR